MLDVTEHHDSERTSAVIDVRDLDAPENFDRYITGEEKIFLCMSSSDIIQTLLSNVRRPTWTTELSLPSSSLFSDSRTRTRRVKP